MQKHLTIKNTQASFRTTAKVSRSSRTHMISFNSCNAPTGNDEQNQRIMWEGAEGGGGSGGTIMSQN